MNCQLTLLFKTFKWLDTGSPNPKMCTDLPMPNNVPALAEAGRIGTGVKSKGAGDGSGGVFWGVKIFWVEEGIWRKSRMW